MGVVLCSLLGFPCFRVGALPACGVFGASSLWGLLSRLPLVVGPPSQVYVGPSPALAVGWFGHTSVAPPAAPVCGVSVALFCRLWLLRALPCRVFACVFPWFRDQAPGVFLASFLWLFPLASVGYGWLGVVVACASCRVPCLRLTLCSLTCVGLDGCLSFFRVGPARSH